MQILLTQFALFFCLIFFSIDLYFDWSRGSMEGESLAYLVGEPLVFCFVLGVLITNWVTHNRLNATNRVLQKQVSDSHRQLKRIQSDVAELIRCQLDTWQLTESEKEVAWLIIKGFSFAEIASIRHVKAKTIRQQAASIYKKSGTSSRSDFTAQFFEDLLAAG